MMICAIWAIPSQMAHFFFCTNYRFSISTTNPSMSRFKYILSLLTAIVTLTTSATSYNFLTFVKTDGNKVFFSVKGLIITYDDYAHAIIQNNVTSDTLNLTNLDYMFFSNDGSDSIRGDVNGDGEINIADVNALIYIILGNISDNDFASRADVNGDSEVNIADVNTLIDIILTT